MAMKKKSGTPAGESLLAARSRTLKRGETAGKASPTASRGPAEPKSVAISVATESDLKRELRLLRAQLASAMAEIEALRISADTDVLLDILNRRGFERELKRSIAYLERYGATATLVMLDVDGLKPINDTYGHAAGDTVLTAIAATVREHARASDLFGRLGGDEFALLLWNLSEKDARVKAASLEAAIDRLDIVVRGQSVRTGVSAGIAVLAPGLTAEAILARADSAMYDRKAERRMRRTAPATVRR
ncbi:GGDEF domain-containing protein [soil metagenome]